MAEQGEDPNEMTEELQNVTPAAFPLGAHELTRGGEAICSSQVQGGKSIDVICGNFLSRRKVKSRGTEPVTFFFFPLQ